LWPLLLASALAWSTPAAAQPACRDVVSIDAVGYAIVPEEGVEVDAAVISALSTAIASVHGIDLVAEASFVERFHLGAQPGGAALTTEVVNEISSRLAGYVLGFTVLDRSSADPYGGVVATVRARLCRDPRLMVSLRAAGGLDPDAFLGALAAHVAPQAERLGWWLVPAHAAGIDPSSPARTPAVFDAGATVVLQGNLIGQEVSRSAHAVSYEAVLSYAIVDVLSGAILASDATLSARGVGYTLGAAIDDTFTQLGASLSRAVTLALVDVQDVPIAHFTFAPILRPATRHTLADRLRTISGVIEVENVALNGTNLVISVRINGDACRIAEELTTWTRVRTQVERCQPERATLRVLRE
jgi:hypothetical protein